MHVLHRILHHPHSWLKHNRRLGTRYETLAVHYLAMLKLAFISRYLRLLEPSDTA